MARGGSNAIGSAAVILSANADGLVAGLMQSEKRLQKFGSNVGKSLTTAVKGGGGIGSKLAAFNGSSAISKLGAVAGGGFAGIAGATAAGASLGSLAGPPGAIAGALVGLTVGGAKAGFDMLGALPGLYERLQGSAQGSDKNVLAGVTNAFTRLEEAGDRFLTAVLVPLGPAIALAADSGSGLLDSIAPAFQFGADAGSALLFIGVEIAKTSPN